jgi:O-antigen ligase
MKKAAGSADSQAGFGIALAIAVPIVLMADVLVGGFAGEAFLLAAFLQILACFVIAWCILDARMQPMSSAAITMLAIVLATVTYCILQLAPLPYAWWTALPGREAAADALRIAAVGEVSQPISLRSDHTAYGVLQILPPIAILMLVAKMPWRTAGLVLPGTIIAVAVLSSVLGLAQTFFREQELLFLHDSVRGGAPGVFYSPNHQATLQLMAIPFVAVNFARIRSRIGQGDAYQGYALVLIAAFVMLVTGVFLSGSFAGVALLVPCLMATVLIANNRGKYWHVVLGFVLAAVGAVALGSLAFTSPWLTGLGLTDFSDGPLGRKNTFELAWKMAADHLPWGAGLGTFEDAFPAYEDAATVTPSYIHHVHNDYIEVVLELGVAGALALAAVVGWWMVMSVNAWRSGGAEGGRLKQAASAALAVVLLHSAVDYPARTVAIACLAAVCAGLLASGPRHGERARAGGHGNVQHRHVEL